MTKREEKILKQLETPCECCGGTGKSFNDEQTGSALRKLRDAHEITALEVSKKMNVGKQTVWKLENGKQKWTQELVENYLHAVKMSII